jgi:hypothetical protein
VVLRRAIVAFRCRCRDFCCRRAARLLFTPHARQHAMLPFFAGCRAISCRLPPFRRRHFSYFSLRATPMRAADFRAASMTPLTLTIPPCRFSMLLLSPAIIDIIEMMRLFLRQPCRLSPLRHCHYFSFSFFADFHFSFISPLIFMLSFITPLLRRLLFSFISLMPFSLFRFISSPRFHTPLLPLFAAFIFIFIAIFIFDAAIFTPFHASMLSFSAFATLRRLRRRHIDAIFFAIFDILFFAITPR